MRNTPHTFRLYGLTSVGGRKEYAEKVNATPGARDIHIQQSTDTDVNTEGQALAGFYDGFANLVADDIKTGDKLVDNIGRDFRVDGVELHDQGRPANNYYKIVLSLQQ